MSQKQNRCLIVQHVSNEFLEDEPEVFEILTRRIIEHIDNSDYDRVIVTTWQNRNTGCYELDARAHLLTDWNFCWERPEEYERLQEEGFDLEVDTDRLFQGNYHTWLYLYDWIEELKEWEVEVCGGFRYACLQSLRETFQHMGSWAKELEHLCYDYCPQRGTPFLSVPIEKIELLELAEAEGF